MIGVSEVYKVEVRVESNKALGIHKSAGTSIVDIVLEQPEFRVNVREYHLSKQLIPVGCCLDP